MYLKRFFTLLAYRREIHDVRNDETGLIEWLPSKFEDWRSKRNEHLARGPTVQ